MILLISWYTTAVFDSRIDDMLLFAAETIIFFRILCG